MYVYNDSLNAKAFAELDKVIEFMLDGLSDAEGFERELALESIRDPGDWGPFEDTEGRYWGLYVESLDMSISILELPDPA